MVSKLAMGQYTFWFSKHVLIFVVQLKPTSLLSNFMTPLSFLSRKSNGKAVYSRKILNQAYSLSLCVILNTNFKIQILIEALEQPYLVLKKRIGLLSHTEDCE